ncbi:MAG: HAMP domain-containing histidine kinase [Atopobiaceae bacterium]|nr:HAMP domain-containing histidine kinase [Atopobiaceae bacterium]
MRTSPRTSSIARSIGWSNWWRKLVGWLFFDLLLVTIALFIFAYRCNESVIERETLNPASYFSHMALEGDGMSISTWRYEVTTFDDNVTHSFYLLPAVEDIWPVPAFILGWQLISLFGVFGDIRRVRRKLQPLNDLAVMADTLGQVGVVDPMTQAASNGADKMATLEQAIARASVDSPTVSTGDQDLRSIEIALNGLLRQMQEAKLQQMRFVNDASHELRTPIAVIQGYVGMLDRWGKTDPTVLEESIEALRAESDHMQELVEQLLFLARGDSGRNTLQKEPLNLADVVREVWEESEMIDPEHTYTCTVDEADTRDPRYQMVGDLVMVKQSMRIMVQNAQKYSSAGTSIRLSVATDPTGVSYMVQDEGMGMSEKDAAHVFERFYRADGARNEGTEGSGLGLSIAKWIVDAHNGTIEVVSREGVGTRFTVRFPR